MLRGGRLIYWIANVAVHPDFQGRGIARQLTERSLQFLRERGIRAAWLQVREDNPTAQHIYRAAGFVERMRRTTWQVEPNLFVSGWADPAVSVRPRRSRDWALQAEWLKQTYPQEVAWSMSLNLSSLSPGLFQRLYAWFVGKEEEHWEALVGEQAAGFASWQASHSVYDQLWLAVPEQENEKAIVALLLQARQVLAFRDRPLQVNFPAGRAVEAFKRAGFENHQTLIWMSVSLKTGS
jgi:hypothetical protein